jgi:ATP-dependent Clp protease ATP-binding subunit ClpA
MLGELELQLADREVRITYSPEAKQWVAARGYDKLYGARPMARLIDEEIKGRLVDELLFGSLEHGGVVHVEVDKGELRFIFGERWDSMPTHASGNQTSEAVQ